MGMAGGACTEGVAAGWHATQLHCCYRHTAQCTACTAATHPDALLAQILIAGGRKARQRPLARSIGRVVRACVLGLHGAQNGAPRWLHGACALRAGALATDSATGPKRCLRFDTAALDLRTRIACQPVPLYRTHSACKPCSTQKSSYPSLAATSADAFFPVRLLPSKQALQCVRLTSTSLMLMMYPSPRCAMPGACSMGGGHTCLWCNVQKWSSCLCGLVVAGRVSLASE